MCCWEGKGQDDGDEVGMIHDVGNEELVNGMMLRGEARSCWRIEVGLGLGAG